METFEYQLDGNLWLEAQYEVDYGEEGTYDTPPSPSSIYIDRIWLVTSVARIDISEADPYLLDVKLRTLEELIEKELTNGRD